MPLIGSGGYGQSTGGMLDFADSMIGKAGDWYSKLIGTDEMTKIAEKNYQLQKDQLLYERDLQHQMNLREDTAVQRRVDDLKKAGLSPVLAAGQGASAGPVIHSQAPQREQTPQPNLINAAQTFMALSKMKADISNTAAQKELLAAQIDKTKGVDTLEALSRIKKNQADTKRVVIDNKLSEESGLGSSPSVVGKIYKDIVGASGGGLAKGIVDTIKDKTQSAEIQKAKKDAEEIWKQPADTSRYLKRKGGN